jgi:uncharacterized protein YggE
MRSFLCALILLAAASLAFGQMDSSSITVTASRSMTLEPDQAVFAVVVTSSLTTGLDQVVAALQGTGITAANLVSVNTVVFPSFAAPSVMGLQWSFVLAVPLSMSKSTAASLAALEQKIVQDGLSLTFQLQGTSVSAQSEQAQQCPISDLLADATAQSKKLADAAQLSVGPVLAISVGQPVAVAPIELVTVAPGITSTGSASGSGVGSISLPVPLPVRNSVSICSLTVKFTLYRYH